MIEKKKTRNMGFVIIIFVAVSLQTVLCIPTQNDSESGITFNDASIPTLRQFSEKRRHMLSTNSDLVIAYEGTSFTMSCRYPVTPGHNSSLQLQWHIHQPESIVLPMANGSMSWGRFHVWSSGMYSSTLQLRILPVELTDRGTYECEGSSDDLAVSKVVSVWVRPVEGGEAACSHTQLRCASSGQCIFKRYRCDGTPDCPDGSDEFGCEYSSCEDGFRCDNGQCVSKEAVCDKHQSYDCRDGSDEIYCSFKNSSGDVLQQTARHHNIVYSAIAAVVTIVSTVSIIVVAVCRMRMRQHAASPRRRGRQYQTQLTQGHIPRDGLSSQVNDMPHLEVSVDNIYMGGQVPLASGHMIRPPSYGDVVGRQTPPPAYSTLDRKAASTSAHDDKAHNGCSVTEHQEQSPLPYEEMDGLLSEPASPLAPQRHL